MFIILAEIRLTFLFVPALSEFPKLATLAKLHTQIALWLSQTQQNTDEHLCVVLLVGLFCLFCEERLAETVPCSSVPPDLDNLANMLKKFNCFYD